MEDKTFKDRDAKGQFLPGIKPKGRPPGVINRFTALKQDLLECWKESGAKERFLSMLKGNKTDFKWATERILSILPRDAIMDKGDGSKVIINIINNKGETIDIPNNPPIENAEIAEQETPEETEGK